MSRGATKRILLGKTLKKNPGSGIKLKQMRTPPGGRGPEVRSQVSLGSSKQEGAAKDLARGQTPLQRRLGMGERRLSFPRRTGDDPSISPRMEKRIQKGYKKLEKPAF